MAGEPEADAYNRHEERELLLEEYRAFRTALSEVESAGETRVNLFIAVSTGMAAVAALRGDDAMVGTDGRVSPTLFLLLIALLLVGIATLARTVHRNEVATHYRRQLDDIRVHLAGGSERVRELVDWKGSTRPDIHWLGFLFPTRGGLMEIQMLLNSFIAAALLGAAAMNCAAVLYLTRSNALTAGSIAGFLAAWYLQYWRVHQGRDEKSSPPG
jgi:hypothetical protein